MSSVCLGRGYVLLKYSDFYQNARARSPQKKTDYGTLYGEINHQRWQFYISSMTHWRLLNGLSISNVIRFTKKKNTKLISKIYTLYELAFSLKRIRARLLLSIILQIKNRG